MIKNFDIKNIWAPPPFRQSNISLNHFIGKKSEKKFPFQALMRIEF
jgi:hypothetical protein